MESSRVTAYVVVVLLLSIGMCTLAFEIQPTEATTAIYINADGSIEGTSYIQTTDNITYVFTGTIINSFIKVQRNNIVIDGKGHALQAGGASAIGIDLTSRANVTVKNVQIDDFSYGVWLDNCSNNAIIGNNITNDRYGVWIYNCSGNCVSRNNMENNSHIGILLSECSKTNVSENMFLNDGMFISNSYENAVDSNLVNGKPLVYLERVSDYTVSNAGQVILVRCTGIKIEKLDLSSATIGFESWASNDSIICGNNITNNSGGIILESSYYNTISGNNIANNHWYGIFLGSSSNNTICHNSFINNTEQALSYSGEPNVWDDSYPSGGNYWSDYQTRYPDATEIDSSGIWSTAYAIVGSNVDHYPLMTQYVIPEFASFLVLPLFMILTVFVIVSARKRILKERDS